jgi:hypothetical protein
MHVARDLGLATRPTSASRAARSVSPAACGTPAGPIYAVTLATGGPVALGVEAAIVAGVLGACMTDVAFVARAAVGR